MNNLHPYLQIYYKSKYKFKKMLKHYLDIKNNNNYIGGAIVLNNFIFEEYYDEEDNRNNIVIGKKEQCLHGIIDNATPDTVWLEWFSYHRNCNIDKNLIRGEGTVNMMKTFIEYIRKYHPKIQKIKLSDKSEFVCSGVNISLYKLYILKYGKSFYEHKFGFVLDTLNDPEILKKHKQNIELSKNIKINKNLIKQQFEKMLDIKDSLNKHYLTIDLINEFVDNLNDNELVRDFLIRYKIPDNQCAIFEDFLNIIFGTNNFDSYIISLSPIYVK